MAINFPNSPVTGDDFDSSGVNWKYDGEKWVSQASGGSGGGASVTVSESPPGTAASGDLWYDSSTDDGRLYVYYEDGSSDQWVDASPEGGGGGSESFWDRTGTTLSPATAGDDVEVGNITLRADGYASIKRDFAGPGEDVVELNSNAGPFYFYCSNTSGGDRKFSVDTAGNVVASGSATVSGVVQTDSYFYNQNANTAVAGMYLLNNSGAARSDNALYISKDNTTANRALSLNYDGSAEFGGSNIFLNADGQVFCSNVITSSALAGSGTRALYADSSGGLTIQSSDRRLKRNITTLPDQIQVVKALNPVSFNWIEKERLGAGLEIGFIAQEVEEIVPEVVRSTAGILSVDYAKLTATLTSALQTALTRIEALEAKVQSLEGGS